MTRCGTKVGTLSGDIFPPIWGHWLRLRWVPPHATLSGDVDTLSGDINYCGVPDDGASRQRTRSRLGESRESQPGRRVPMPRSPSSIPLLAQFCARGTGIPPMGSSGTRQIHASSLTAPIIDQTGGTNIGIGTWHTAQHTAHGTWHMAHGHMAHGTCALPFRVRDVQDRDLQAVSGAHRRVS
jgi:hypothetical protein